MGNTCVIEVKTTSGTMRCYKNADPLYPGFSIVFQPCGVDYEIDLAYVDMKESREAVVNEYDEIGDISIYVFGNPYSEDYTNKTILKRNEIINALTIAAQESVI